MKKIYFILFVLMFSLIVTADGQQLARRSQLAFNPYMVNPAVAGTLNETPIFLSYRNQWMGFKGAPTTMMASAHKQGPENSGFGAILSHDDAGGAISRTNLELTGAYHIDLNNYDAVSFGLSVVAGQYKFDNSKLVVYDPNDLALNGGIAESQLNVDATFGMLVYGRDYYFGFSVPNLFQTSLRLETPNSSDNYNLRQFQVMGSYKYFLNEDWDIQPSGFMKFTLITPVQLDANVKMGYRETVWGGITYRHNDAVAVNIGGLYENFFMGYSYDITTTRANVLSPHTHELMIGYIISGKRGLYQSRSALGPRILPRGRVKKG